MAGQLTKAGIRTQLKVYEWTTYMNNIAYRHGGAPIWLIGWGNTTWDADNTLTNMFQTGEPLANYWNTEFNTLLDDARTITDPKKRQAMYSKIAKIFMEDAPVISLYQQIDKLRGEPEARLGRPLRRADRRLQHDAQAVGRAVCRLPSAVSLRTDPIRS